MCEYRHGERVVPPFQKRLQVMEVVDGCVCGQSQDIRAGVRSWFLVCGEVTFDQVLVHPVLTAVVEDPTGGQGVPQTLLPRVLLRVPILLTSRASKELRVPVPLLLTVKLGQEGQVYELQERHYEQSTQHHFEGGTFLGEMHNREQTAKLAKHKAKVQKKNTQRGYICYITSVLTTLPAAYTAGNSAHT